MSTRHTTTRHPHGPSCLAFALYAALGAGLIALTPAFAEPDGHHLAAMQTMHSVEMAIEFPGLHIERDQIKNDGRRYIAASHPATGLNLSIALEPVQGVASAAGCVEQLQHVRQGQAVSRGQDIVLTTAPAVQTLAYTLREFRGVRLDQKSIYACMAEGHVYAKIHLSKVGFSSADAALFEQVIQSIRLQPGHSRSMPRPSPSATGTASRAEGIKYAQDGSAHAIAP